MPVHLRRGVCILLSVCLSWAALQSGCRPRAAVSSSAGSGPRAAGPSLRLRDVARAAGLSFTPDRSLRPPLDILQTAGYGGGFLDYDGDGWLDVLLVGSPGCRLYRNTHDGRFVDRTAAAGLDIPGHWMGCASADYDNDGRPDLFLSGYRAAALLHNEGGRFCRVPLDFPADHWGTSTAFFDYDGDGWLDLYVGCYVRFDPDTPRLCSFAGVRAACAPSHYDAQAGHLYRNLRGRDFREVTAETGLDRTHGKTLGVAACDCNGDGWQDLYLANDGMPGDLFLNQGGRFTEAGLISGTAFNGEGREQAGMGVDWADVDGDGRPDLVVTTFQFEPTSLYLNRGAAVFREAAYLLGLGDATVRTLGFGVKFFDPDNDGSLDLIIANGHVQDAIGQMQPGVSFPQSAQLFQWRGDRFVEATGEGTEAVRKRIVGRSAAVGDYDNDGRQDVLITNLEGPPLLLHNETPAVHHWLSLRLEGRAASRDATGAVVTVRAGGRTLVRYAGTGGSYLSCSDPRVHMGLGAAARVEALTVRWPDGRAETWSSLPIDRQLIIREGWGSSKKAPAAASPPSSGPVRGSRF